MDLNWLVENWVLVVGGLTASGILVGPAVYSKVRGKIPFVGGTTDNRADLSAALCLINDHVTKVGGESGKAGEAAVTTLAPIVMRPASTSEAK